MRHVWMGLGLLLAMGCGGDSVVEPEPDPVLTGHWVGSTPVATSSGGSYEMTLDLTLSEAAGGVTGSGFVRVGGAASWAVTVRQGTNSYPAFSLVLDLEGMEDMTYSGSFNSAAELLGKLNGSGFVDQWLVLRKG